MADMALASPTWGVVIMTGTGNGTFALGSTYPNVYPGGGTYPYRVEASKIFIGDFNSDSHSDVAAMEEYGEVFIFLGNGDGTLAFNRFYYPRANLQDFTFGDYNRDGTLDLLTATSTNSHHVQVWLGAGDGTFGYLPPPTTRSVGTSIG